MKIQVSTNKLSVLEKDNLNENEYKVHEIEFVFNEEYTQDLVKVALFTIDDKTYKVIVSNNKCNIPPEILAREGTYVLGLYAYKEEDGDLVIRYSPTPLTIFVAGGSYIPDEDTENSEPITPSEMEQFEQALNEGLVEISTAISQASNLDVDVNKVGGTATIIITDKDGNEKSVNILDGKDGKDGDTGPIGETGRGILNITKTSTSGLVDTYTIQYTTGNPTTYTVINGEKRRYRCKW